MILHGIFSSSLSLSLFLLFPYYTYRPRSIYIQLENVKIIKFKLDT